MEANQQEYSFYQARRKKSKRRILWRRILFFFAGCGFLALLIAISNQLYQSIVLPLSLSGEQTNAETSWSLILVNKWNPIPDDYSVQLTALSGGETVDTRIYPALQKMFDTARSHNIYPVVVSGYRTTETQQRFMDEKIAAYEQEGLPPDEAKTKAEAWVALPGTSEHQLGISVDINADGIFSTGEEVYQWLDENAYRFGFIRRYPPDKIELTGVINEPWHYRYVGVKAATEIQNSGVCLEEYLGRTDGEQNG